MVKDVHYTDPSRQGTPPPEEDIDQQIAASKFVSGLEPIQKQRKKAKRNKIILIALLFAAVLGAAGYFLLSRSKKQEPAPQQQTSQTETTEAPQEVPTEKYNSSDLQLSLDYPNNWTVDDSEQGLLKITSPDAKLNDSSGMEVDAKVVFTIVSAGSEVTGFKGESGVAAADSEKISYDQPTQSQREQTYLTQVGFGGDGLDVVYITGDSGYKEGQDVPKGDVEKIEPIISVTFQSGDGQPLAIAPGEWTSKPILLAAQKIIKSLQIN